jgi:hypothetical protein
MIEISCLDLLAIQKVLFIDTKSSINGYFFQKSFNI